MTRPAPFADIALLFAHTDTRASWGLEKASAEAGTATGDSSSSNKWQQQQVAAKQHRC